MAAEKSAPSDVMAVCLNCGTHVNRRAQLCWKCGRDPLDYDRPGNPARNSRAEAWEDVGAGAKVPVALPYTPRSVEKLRDLPKPVLELLRGIVLVFLVPSASVIVLLTLYTYLSKENMFRALTLYVSNGCLYPLGIAVVCGYLFYLINPLTREE